MILQKENHVYNFHSGDSGTHIFENRAINYFVQKTPLLLLHFFNLFVSVSSVFCIRVPHK